MTASIVLHQTADANLYFPMLAATMPANRAFCLNQGVRMEAFIGIRRGMHPWQATFNRLAVLRDLLTQGFEGWLIHLDADAFVTDPRFDLRGYLAKHGEAAMIHPPGGGGAGDIIAGVFLWNFARPETRRLAMAWVAAFDAIPDQELEQAVQWNILIDESVLLRRLLRAEPDLASGLHVESDALIGYPHSSFIKQFVRNNVHTLEQRTARIAQAVETAMRRGGAQPVADETTIRRAAAMLLDAAPDMLELAVARHQAAALAVTMAQLCRTPRDSD